MKKEIKLKLLESAGYNIMEQISEHDISTEEEKKRVFRRSLEIYRAERENDISSRTKETDINANPFIKEMDVESRTKETDINANPLIKEKDIESRTKEIDIKAEPFRKKNFMNYTAAAAAVLIMAGAVGMAAFLKPDKNNMDISEVVQTETFVTTDITETSVTEISLISVPFTESESVASKEVLTGTTAFENTRPAVSETVKVSGTAIPPFKESVSANTGTRLVSESVSTNTGKQLVSEAVSADSGQNYLYLDYEPDIDEKSSVYMFYNTAIDELVYNIGCTGNEAVNAILLLIAEEGDEIYEWKFSANKVLRKLEQAGYKVTYADSDYNFPDGWEKVPDDIMLFYGDKEINGKTYKIIKGDSYFSPDEIVKISASDVSAAPGEKAVAEVSFEEAEAVNEFNFRISCDDSVLSLENAYLIYKDEKGVEHNVPAFFFNNERKTCTFDSVYTKSLARYIVRLEFEVSEDAEEKNCEIMLDSYSVGVSRTEECENMSCHIYLPVQFKNGSVNITTQSFE